MIFKNHYPEYWSCHFDNNNVEIFTENNNNKDNLVIAIGDSWTWGDSLNNSSITPHRDDSKYRTDHVYGNIVANKLDADFVNIAFPGAGNYWILDRFKIIAERELHKVKRKYGNITILITLTESGRLLEFRKYTDALQISNFDSYANVLTDIELFDFTFIEDICSRLPDNVRVVVGRNFTDTFDVNKQAFVNVTYVDTTWLELLFKEQEFAYDNACRIMSGIGYYPFDDYMKHNVTNKVEYKEWFLQNIVETSLARIALLEQSKLNYQKATKHPTEDAHEIWADHLLTYITK
jgi:hypothetical protein